MNEQGGELGQPTLVELLVEFPYGYIAGRGHHYLSTIKPVYK